MTFKISGIYIIPGIRTETTNTRVTNNLVTLTIWDGAYQDRLEAGNVRFPGSIEGFEATDLILINNTLMGNERLGFNVKGQACTTLDADLWYGNVAIGNLAGKFFPPNIRTVINMDV